MLQISKVCPVVLYIFYVCRVAKFKKHSQVFPKSQLEDSQISFLFPPDSRNIPTRILGKPGNSGKVK
jgi:hypothetical protein